jgi:methylmalonyl-CoA carboxyltransferase 12S subunit
MKTETGDLTGLLDAIDSLRREVRRLGERVAALEASAGPAPLASQKVEAVEEAPTSSKAETHHPGDPVVSEELGEELLLVISAAIAAFLGKKAHIRQIHLIGSAAWAQQGRVTIQASHALSVHSARS